MRIISLVPGITEFLFAVGLGDQVVGRSHRCDHPAEAAAVPAVSRGPDGPPPPLSAGTVLGGPALTVEERALIALQPELVIGPDGAMPTGDWREIALQPPGRLDDLLAQLQRIGTAAGAGGAAGALVQRLRTRLGRLEMVLEERTRPRTAVIEWTAPLLTPGLWVPDLVEAGGGHNVFGAAGKLGAVAEHGELAAAQPDVVLLAFSGLALYEAQARLHDLMKHPQWLPATRAARVMAIDAAAYVSRPGPRLVDGAELVAWALHRPHPVMQPPPGRIAELIEAGWVDLAAVRSHVEESA